MNKKNVFINNFDISLSEMNKAIVFIKGEWSPTANILDALLKMLPEELSLFVLDNEHEKFDNFLYQNKLKTHGMGETFWIKNGNVIFKILKYEKDALQKIQEYNEAIK